MAFTMLSHLGVLAEAELLHQERPSIGNTSTARSGATSPPRTAIA